jgi:GAF domain-containing protein
VSIEDPRTAVATSQDFPVNATEALERLGRLSLRELSMQTLLETVASLARTVMPGESEASVTLVVKGRPTTVASTGQLALDLDESQYERGRGPCLHAARTGELTEIPDTRTEARWPDYARVAVEHGNLSSLSVPLSIDEDDGVVGALNLYAREPHAFDEARRSAATGFGSYAAVATGNLYAFQSARTTADNLQLALESRAVIDQAKGILMERHRLTADESFQLLAQASMDANRKVHAVAEHLVRTGEMLTARPGHPDQGGRAPGGAPAGSPGRR